MWNYCYSKQTLVQLAVLTVVVVVFVVFHYFNNNQDEHNTSASFLNSLLKKLRLFPNKIRQDIIYFQQNCNVSIIATHGTLACSFDTPGSGSANNSRSQNCITDHSFGACCEIWAMITLTQLMQSQTSCSFRKALTSKRDWICRNLSIGRVFSPGRCPAPLFYESLKKGPELYRERRFTCNDLASQEPRASYSTRLNSEMEIP